MAIKTLYTAVGRFERRTNGCNRSCPIILLGGQEYMADMQEMVIWSMLNWRILRWDDIAQEYEKQALLSTAEIIKCIDKNISRLPNECALLDSLYGDETTTSDNIASMVKISQSSKPVTLAVANLYLRQQIIFERV